MPVFPNEIQIHETRSDKAIFTQTLDLERFFGNGSNSKIPVKTPNEAGKDIQDVRGGKIGGGQRLPRSLGA